MDVSDIKKDAISLWFSDDNTNFYGTELTDKAYSKDGIVWHFAYVNRNNPEEYWNNQSKDCEYRVVSWRKENLAIMTTYIFLRKVLFGGNHTVI